MNNIYRSILPGINNKQGRFSLAPELSEAGTCAQDQMLLTAAMKSLKLVHESKKITEEACVCVLEQARC